MEPDGPGNASVSTISNHSVANKTNLTSQGLPSSLVQKQTALSSSSSTTGSPSSTHALYSYMSGKALANNNSGFRSSSLTNQPVPTSSSVLSPISVLSTNSSNATTTGSSNYSSNNNGSWSPASSSTSTTVANPLFIKKSSVTSPFLFSKYIESVHKALHGGSAQGKNVFKLITNSLT
jgi:hypothetical protein